MCAESCAAEQMLGRRHVAVEFNSFITALLVGKWSDGMFVREADSSLMFVAFVLKVLIVVFLSLYSIAL